MAEPQAKWNVAAAQREAVANYRAWSKRLVEEARGHDRRGELVQSAKCWDGAVLCNQAADREARG